MKIKTAMDDNSTSGEIRFGWGSAAALLSNGATSMDISKTGGATDQDQLLVDWGGSA